MNIGKLAEGHKSNVLNRQTHMCLSKGEIIVWMSSLKSGAAPLHLIVNCREVNGCSYDCFGEP